MHGANVKRATFEVYNELGMLVRKMNTISGTTRGGVSAYAKWIYAVRINPNGGLFNKQFTVMR